MASRLSSAPFSPVHKKHANCTLLEHWGHATTTDGYTFENQPIAIFPPNNETFVFSGSAVVDVNNTSGYFPGQDNGVVAIYTLNNSTSQNQNIAFSKDGGYTFEPYEGNPVIDIGSTQFRDPQVIIQHNQRFACID